MAIGWDDINALSERELLELRFSDLKLSLKEGPISASIARLYRELASKGLKFRPNVFICTEWYSPGGLNSIAVPFYLAHPKLAWLEKKQMGEAEGQGQSAAMKLLRHEAGHAFETAYGIRRRKKRQMLFGLSSSPMGAYQPDPKSHNFVEHLPEWYAQSHPDEDFAETFAVVLNSTGAWRKKYSSWPVENKLTYIESLMDELKGVVPPYKRRAVSTLSQNHQRLKHYYRKKKSIYGGGHNNPWDKELKLLFNAQGHRKMTAPRLLRKMKRELVSLVALKTGESQYAVNHIVSGMIRRSEELGLEAQSSEKTIKQAVLGLLTLNTKKYLYRGPKPLTF